MRVTNPIVLLLMQSSRTKFPLLTPSYTFPVRHSLDAPSTTRCNLSAVAPFLHPRCIRVSPFTRTTRFGRASSHFLGLDCNAVQHATSLTVAVHLRSPPSFAHSAAVSVTFHRNTSLQCISSSRHSAHASTSAKTIFADDKHL